MRWAFCTPRDDGLFVYACDYAEQAVKVVRAEPEYDERRCFAFVNDISRDELDLPAECLDVVVLIFVLSALRPERWVRLQGRRDPLARRFHAAGCGVSEQAPPCAVRFSHQPHGLQPPRWQHGRGSEAPCALA